MPTPGPGRRPQLRRSINIISHDGSVCMPLTWIRIYHQEIPQIDVSIFVFHTYGSVMGLASTTQI